MAVPDATRADTAYLTALERITLQMTAKLHLDDVLATITQGLVEEFPALRLPLVARPRGPLHRLLSGRRLC